MVGPRAFASRTIVLSSCSDPTACAAAKSTRGPGAGAIACRGRATGSPDTAPADLDEAVALFVDGLSCDVCGLHLSAGELQLAGAPLIVPLPNVSTGELDDFYSTTMDSAEPS